LKRESKVLEIVRREAIGTGGIAPLETAFTIVICLVRKVCEIQSSSLGFLFAQGIWVGLPVVSYLFSYMAMHSVSSSKVRASIGFTCGG